MSFDFAAKDQGVYEWLKKALGDNFPIVQAQQNAPRPTDSSGEPTTYVTFQNGNIIRQGTGDELRYKQGDDAFEVWGQRRVNYLIEAIGANAFSTISDVQNSLGLPSCRDLLRARGLGVVDEGNVVDITKFLETEFEPRAQLTVTFAYTTVTSEDPGRIEKVNLNGNLNGVEYDFDIEN